MRALFLSIIILSVVSQINAQDDCCSTMYCKTEAKFIAENITSSLAVLGTCPPSKEEAQKKLNELSKTDIKAYNKIFKAKDKYLSFTKKKSDLKNCVMSFIDDIDIMQWITILFIDDESVEPTSPEFCKGFGIQPEINFGVQNPYSDKESFAQSLNLLFSYTFAKKDCGGTTRIMLGPSLYHYYRSDYLMGTLRFEFRLKDISTMVGSIANIKLITQGSANELGFIAGLGAGLEIGKKATIQVLPQFNRINEKNTYSVLFGLGYRFFK